MQNPKKILRLCFLLLVVFEITSCSVVRKPSEARKNSALSDKIITLAQKYEGVPYRSGGEDFSGMDCSGLLCSVFKEMGLKIPRISWQQAEFFTTVVSKDEIRKGDLVFFITNGSKNINHSGIVTEVKSKSEVKFISALSSKGVAEDNLNSNYWRSKLAKITRPSIRS